MLIRVVPWWYLVILSQCTDGEYGCTVGLRAGWPWHGCHFWDIFDIWRVRRHLILGKRDSLSNSDTQTLFWDKEYTFLDKVSTLPRSHFWKEYMNMYSFWPRFAPAVRQRDGRGRLVSCALKTEVCRGPVELHCEGGNHARDCILVLFYSRLSLNRVFFPSKMLATY